MILLMIWLVSNVEYIYYIHSVDDNWRTVIIIIIITNGCMDGWMDEWMDEWMEGRMDRQMNRRM